MIWLAGLIFAYYICNPFAGIAQLVEHDLAKVGVAGPSPVSRSREEQGVQKGTLFFMLSNKTQTDIYQYA